MRFMSFPPAHPAGTEEHRELSEGLALIRAAITQVDAQVNDYEKATRLKEIGSKIEPKSVGRVKDGWVLSREELGRGGRKLLHEGTVTWKAASGRLKGAALRLSGRYL